MAEAASVNGSKRARPISPHLQIYSPLINMVMSILHRITGGALYFGTLLFAAWVVSAAAGQASFDYVNGLIAASPYGVPIGRIVLFGYTWVLVHHMLGGIRHLIWDTGRGFALANVDLLCWGTIILSVAITLAIWVLAGHLRGGI